MLPEAKGGGSDWRRRAVTGVVAATGKHRSRFEVSSMRLYDKADDALDLSQPDWNGDGGDRALVIAHQLEHGLFEVKASIEAMLRTVKRRAEEDRQRIVSLEDNVSTSALAVLEKRLAEVETRLTGLSAPIIDARVKQVEAVASRRLDRLTKDISSRSSGSWHRPFVVVLLLISVFAFYSYREYRSLSKCDSTYM